MGGGNSNLRKVVPSDSSADDFPANTSATVSRMKPGEATEVIQKVLVNLGTDTTADGNTVDEENGLVRKGVYVVDTALQLQENSALAFEFASALYGTLQKGGSESSETMIQDAVAVAGSVAGALFPVLLDLGKTVPLVGPVAAIALQFYGSVKTYLSNKEDLQQLTGRVQDCLVWFKQTAACISMLPKEQLQQLRRYLSRLIAAIMAANEMMEGWKDRWSASKLVLSERDKESIGELAAEVERARNDMSLHSTSVLFQLVMAMKGKSESTEQLELLQELKKMVGGVETSFRSDIDTHLARFVRGSRSWMHEMIRSWLENGESKMFWVLADAGMGKSAFVASVVEYMEPRGQLAACFFCKYGNRHRSNEEAVMLSLVYQIAERYPECLSTIVSEMRRIRDDSVWKGMSFKEKMTALFFSPLRQLDRQSALPVVLIVDALDEIGVQGSKERKELLQVLKDCLVLLPPWVKLLMTSRPEADILAIFAQFGPTMISADDVRHQEDLRVYTRAQLQGYLSFPACADAAQQAVTTTEAVELLIRQSGGRFVYMSLVASDLFVGNAQKYTLETLEAVLPKGLDDVYLASFERIRNNVGVKRFKQSVWPLVCMLVSMLEPLLYRDAQQLLAYSQEEMKTLAGLLSAMFPLAGEDESSWRFTLFHKTVADWLLDEQKSRKAAGEDEVTLFWLQDLLEDVDVSKVKEYLSCLEKEELCGFGSLATMCDDAEEWQSCLSALPRVVKKKIKDYVKTRSASVEHSGGEVKSVNREMRHDFFAGNKQGHDVHSARMLALMGLSSAEALPGLSSQQLEAASRCSYLVNYMVHHLADAGHEQVAQILSLQLPWLLLALRHRVRGVWDILSDIRYVLQSCKGVGVEACNPLQLLEKSIAMSASVLASCSGEELVAVFVLHIVGRLRQVRYDGIVDHKEASSLLTSQQLVDSSLEWLKSEKRVVPVSYALEAPGGSLLNTLRGHADAVQSVCMSADGSRIVSGSWDHAIKVWDSSSGECLQTLVNHGHWVTSVCISADGSHVVSGSWDKTIDVCNVLSGECLQTLEGHNGFVQSVCISADGSRIVSASKDKTIKVWDVSLGKCLQTLAGHTDSVLTVCILTDGSRIVSGSEDKTIKVWDSSSGECLQTLEGHSGSVKGVCISADGSHIVSGSDDKSIKVWDSSSGQCLKTLIDHSDSVYSVCVSADGSRIVSGSNDRTIKVWDVSSGECLQTLSGHPKEVLSVCISADGSRVVSGSYDRTVKVWDFSLGECQPSSAGHSKGVLSMYTRMLLDGSCRIVSGSKDGTIKVWDTSTGECLQTIIGHNHWVLSVCISADGSRVASASLDKAIKVWDFSSGECLQTLEGHSGYVMSLCISADGCRIVSGSEDKTIKVWDSSSGKCLQTLAGHNGYVMSLFLSADGSRIVSGSTDTTIKVWDVSSGECLQTLEGHSESVTSVCTSANNMRIVSGSEDKTIKLWDANSGLCVETYPLLGDDVNIACLTTTETLFKNVGVLLRELAGACEGIAKTLCISDSLITLGTENGLIHMFRYNV